MDAEVLFWLICLFDMPIVGIDWLGPSAES